MEHKIRHGLYCLKLFQLIKVNTAAYMQQHHQFHQDVA